MDVGLVVCVSPDADLRGRIVRRVDGLAPVLVCADFDELRSTLFGAQPGSRPVPRDTPVPGERPPAESSRPVSYGDLMVDPVGHLVTWRGGPLSTTRRERELLVRLIRPPVVVWPYERLFVEVWGGTYLGDTSILHSAVKRLRRKLRAVAGAPLVETVRGVGYRLAPVG
ncbi:winged helix-turn-helix domain-containing protein [Solwaraspora sp. WMMD1047]|uniref:winged helix-turn-helix domain-containing protein n=1 Tax=Solwaraspora sp. WMMD1047 TaxID=3016102 RepID=UPI002416E5E2|nr:winged helix-turn-helix domain-containing protein [Solwaraspora sp. WMMD1047]MDG4831633.1 winged helix-turn-helix domain-containing protein [Solwaraspora sp. WMMD1047]